MQDVLFTFMYEGKKKKAKLSSVFEDLEGNAKLSISKYKTVMIVDKYGNLNPEVFLLSTDVLQHRTTK